MLNEVNLIGNLGQDPKITATQFGKEIASFSLATTESWKDKKTGEKKNKTEWHRVVIFSEPLVNVVAQYLKKGSKVYIQGSLTTREWEDKSGIKRHTTEIVLGPFNSKLVMLSSKEEEVTDNRKRSSPDSILDISDDEIPF